MAIVAAVGGVEAAEPLLFDIPRLEKIAVDGKPADWGERGFRVELLQGVDGTLKPAEESDARFRLGWDSRGVQRVTEPDADSAGPGGWLFLAMAHARLGHAAQARLWLARATAWLENAQSRNVTRIGSPLSMATRLLVQHLHREAEALIPPASAR
jgi:hypothetical protein